MHIMLQTSIWEILWHQCFTAQLIDASLPIHCEEPTCNMYRRGALLCCHWIKTLMRLFVTPGSKQKPSEIGFIMGVEFEKQDNNIISIFLELSGFDDLIGFKSSVEEECHDIVRQACGMGGELGQR